MKERLQKQKEEAEKLNREKVESLKWYEEQKKKLIAES